ncbi:MAG: poly(3-hydroxybutyrate) depolymerase [Rickettsiales bacterium]|nr:poly(3-hydroxybutyrate) depolymerase [Rickettsiales bacterium]
MIPYQENSSLYSWLEMHRAGMAPMRAMASAGKFIFNNPYMPFSYTSYGRQMAAASELFERVTRRYDKPEWGINNTDINGKVVDVEIETVANKPFCNLLHFKRDVPKSNNDPRILVVAPMSGHHATLLRGTVRGLLPYHDVYITDWVDASEVPVHMGKFDLDEYIDYIIEFLRLLGPNTHTMAVCQPSVPLMAAVAVLSDLKDEATPPTMTLMGGPIDTREAPTEVNRLAKEKSLQWFESNVITRVPVNYPGFMRRVYPGFLQLTGFMTMNLDRHVGEHIKLFQHLIEGDGESAAAHRKFYNEYLAVADLPAEFYLQTVREVFQRHALPNGTLMHNRHKVDTGAITDTAILCIEGEKDDISGVGQTKAALNITPNLANAKKHYHLQENVGHYGIFNGRRYRELVRPVITDWTKKHSK